MLLPIAQLTVSIILIVLILMQERSSGLSGVLGGSGGEGGFYQTRRGLEKFVFWATVLFAAAFAVLALVDLLL